MKSRSARLEDAADIVRIYNQGIADRTATFETRQRTESEIRAWFDGAHPLLVVEEEGAVVAFAATYAYRPRACYAGIAETSVYVDRAFRRHGAGRLAAGSPDRRRRGRRLPETALAHLCGQLGQPPAGRRSGLPRGGNIRKARPTGRRVARRGDRRKTAIGLYDGSWRTRADLEVCPTKY